MISMKEINKVLNDLEKFRQEQDELERQQHDLMEKIRERKLAFKALWGVSPMRINTIRTVIPKPNHSPLAKPNQSSPTTIGDSPKPSEPQNSVPFTNSDNLTPQMPKCVEDEDEKTPALDPEIRRVRFHSGAIESRLLTPDSAVQDWSPNPQSFASTTNQSFVSNTNQSFASLKTSFSFLQTPAGDVGERGGRRQQVQQEKEQGTAPGKPGMVGVPTPVALKTLSARVREEYALLYADSSEEEEEEESVDIIRKIKF
jgi:hypothetical protein